MPAIEIAAALARIVQGDQPLLLAPPPKRETLRAGLARARRARDARERSSERRPPRRTRTCRCRPPGTRAECRAHRGRASPAAHEHAAPREFGQRPLRAHATEEGKRTYRIEVGHEHGVKPGNIVGAIANEAGLDSKHIGRISIRDDYSLVDLPDGMPTEMFEHLKKVWVVQQQLRIHEWDGTDTDTRRFLAVAQTGRFQEARRIPAGWRFKPR